MFHRAVHAAALVLSALPLLTPPLAGKDTPEKVIREISRQLQSSGPGQFSLLTLDARLTAAHELSGQLPEEGRKLLNGVRADLKKNGFAQPPDEFVYRMVESLMSLDYDEAEKVALASDAPDALTPLVRYHLQKGHGGALGLISDRIRKGGFHIAAVGDLLPELDDSRDQADILIQSLLRNFPAGKATWVDCRLALDWAGMLIPRHNASASALLQVVLRELSDPASAKRIASATREEFKFGERRFSPDSARECLLMEAAGLLRAIDDEAFRKMVPQLGAYGEPITEAGPMEALTAVRSRRTRTVSLMDLSPASAEAYRAGMRDVASLSPEEAAAKAAQIREDDARLLVQLALLERALVSGDLRTQTFNAALSSAPKLADETLRLRSLARLVRLAGPAAAAAQAPLHAWSDALAVYCKSAGADDPRTWGCANDYNELAAAIGSVDMEDDFQSPALAPYLLLVKLNAHLGDLLDFTLKDVGSGEKVRLMDLRGKVVLLDFWATWCGPCRRELPTVEKLHRELKDKGLVVLTINDESPAMARSFVRDKKYTFTVLDDSKQEVHRRYKVRSIPTLVVFDKQGKMVSYSSGTKGEEALRTLLARAGL